MLKRRRYHLSLKNQFPEDLRVHADAESGHDGWVVRLGTFMGLSY